SLAHTRHPLLSSLPLHAALPILLRRLHVQGDVALAGILVEQLIGQTFSVREGVAEQQAPPAALQDQRAADLALAFLGQARLQALDRKSTRLNSSHVKISYAVFCL